MSKTAATLAIGCVLAVSGNLAAENVIKMAQSGVAPIKPDSLPMMRHDIRNPNNAIVAGSGMTAVHALNVRPQL